jgi:hypothetical protein
MAMIAWLGVDRAWIRDVFVTRPAFIALLLRRETAIRRPVYANHCVFRPGAGHCPKTRNGSWKRGRDIHISRTVAVYNDLNSYKPRRFVAYLNMHLFVSAGTFTCTNMQRFVDWPAPGISTCTNMQRFVDWPAPGTLTYTEHATVRRLACSGDIHLYKHATVRLTRESHVHMPKNTQLLHIPEQSFRPFVPETSGIAGGNAGMMPIKPARLDETPFPPRSATPRPSPCPAARSKPRSI